MLETIRRKQKATDLGLPHYLTMYVTCFSNR